MTKHDYNEKIIQLYVDKKKEIDIAGDIFETDGFDGTFEDNVNAGQRNGISVRKPKIGIRGR